MPRLVRKEGGNRGSYRSQAVANRYHPFPTDSDPSPSEKGAWPRASTMIRPTHQKTNPTLVRMGVLNMKTVWTPVVFLLLPTSLSFAGVSIVRDGKPVAVVVIPSGGYLSVAMRNLGLKRPDNQHARRPHGDTVVRVPPPVRTARRQAFTRRLTAQLQSAVSLRSDRPPESHSVNLRFLHRLKGLYKTTNGKPETS